MPHLTLEYTANLTDFNPRQALGALNESLVASGHFEEPDIKSRAIALDTVAVGTSLEERGFVHARLAILSGRSVAVRQALSEQLLAVLRPCTTAATGMAVQVSVEVQEIERASYSKASTSP
jgi:5-carboxymethyl-2-hydroxymuconate isomerase